MYSSIQNVFSDLKTPPRIVFGDRTWQKQSVLHSLITRLLPDMNLCTSEYPMLNFGDRVLVTSD